MISGQGSVAYYEGYLQKD